MLGSPARLRGRHQPVRFHSLQISESTPGHAGCLHSLLPRASGIGDLTTHYYYSHCLLPNMGTLEPFVGRMSLQSPLHPLGLDEGRVFVANTSAVTSCRNDFTLDPFVRGCRGDFDFTVLFELVILSVIPSVCFLVLSSYRIWCLRQRPVLIRGSLFSLSKLVSDCNQPHLIPPPLPPPLFSRQGLNIRKYLGCHISPRCRQSGSPLSCLQTDKRRCSRGQAGICRFDCHYFTCDGLPVVSGTSSVAQDFGHPQLLPFDHHDTQHS